MPNATLPYTEMTWTASFWTALIGGVTGLIGGTAGILALIDRWRNRHPRLRLFAPYFFSGIDAGNQLPIFSVLLRISNTSEKRAFLYLETLQVQLKSNGRWHKTPRLELDPKITPVTDFSATRELSYGIKQFPVLQKHADCTVSYEQPLTGYIIVTHDDLSILRNARGIKVIIRDCHMKYYELTVDFDEQRKFDPAFSTEGV